MNRQSQPQLNLVSSAANPTLGQPLAQHQPAQQSYNYNHWLIQEAELRRQIATRNGSSLIASTKDQSSLSHKAGNLYKDDQPVYENTIVYNSHKKQQMSGNSMPYLANSQQINKPPFPNPSMIGSQSMIGGQQPAMINSQSSLGQSSMPTSQQSNYLPTAQQQQQQQQQKQQKQILSVSGKKKCSSCGDELGRSLFLNFFQSEAPGESRSVRLPL